MKNLSAIVLAAGKGTRMKSAAAKVLHPVCGRPMLYYPVKVLKGRLGVGKIVVVVGYGAESVKEAFKGRGIEFALQTPQLGTGHAVMTAMKKLGKSNGDVLILSGDVPLITEDTVKALVRIHRGKASPVISFVSVILDNPAGYGRVVRDAAGAVTAIVEDKDLKPFQRDINEVNTGIYLVDSAFLRANLKKLKSANAQREYYLPDIVALAGERNKKVSCLTHAHPDEVMGVNNRIELARASSVMRGRILRALMLEGVTVMDPDSTYADYGVQAGRDTVIHPNTHLLGSTVIGKRCVIEEGAKIKDSKIGDGAVIKSYSIVESSIIGKGAAVGPFARIRPQTTVSDGARIGNFVEVKKSFIGKGSKANHLSYIGDSVVGKNVNIGAGTITCNYDGFKKHRTVIEDGAFIGSDTQLVAPVTVGRGAYVGSGSTITKNVPSGALALSRAEQKIVKGFTKKKTKKAKGA